MIAAILLIAIFTGALAASSQGPSWEQYIVGSQSSTVFPKAIHNFTGNVSNPSGILGNDSKPTILTRASSNDTPPAIVVDFGINTVGFLEIDFASASENHPGLRLAFSETLEYLSNISDFSRSDNGDTITPGSDQIAVAAQPYTWVDNNGCFYPTSKQVCADGLHGFRYLNIYLDALDSDAPYTQSNGSISISSIRLNYTGLISPYKGYFECSDANLTQWWFDGAYTNEMITDTFRGSDVDPRDAASPTLLGKEVLFDGAKRDRDPYVGDIAVSALTDYYTHYLGSPSLNILADLAAHQRSDGWIPPASINNYTLPLFDYPLWWVYTSWQYVLYTGDSSYSSNYLSNVQRLLDGWCVAVTNETSNLLSKGLGGTESYGDYAFLNRDAEVTYYNALYVLALEAGAQLANYAGNKTAAINWKTRAQTVATAINSNLWDDNADAYIDSSNGSVRHPQDGNSLAVLAGVADPERADTSLAYLSKLALPYGNAFMDNDDLVSDGTNRVYAFLSFFEISARFESGDSAGALDEIRRLYGWMAARDPTHTFWEGISTNGTLYEGAYTSAAHGWSTGVTPALTKYILGVQPVEPGYAVFNVTPIVGDLDWAKGCVPAPSGEILVSWSAADSQLGLNVTVPTSTAAQINLPVQFAKSATVNGSSAVVTEHGQYGSLARLGPGEWCIVANGGGTYPGK